MKIPRDNFSIICLLLSTILLVSGSISKSTCLIADIDRDVEEEKCQDKMGNHIETHKSIVATVPNGALCTFACIDGEMKTFWKRCTDGLWEGPSFKCGTDEEYSLTKTKRRQKRFLWGSSSSSEEPPPPPPNTAPVLHCPSVPAVINADRLSISVVVRWSVPRAQDKEQGSIGSTRISGSAPGSRFIEGSHAITYRATDIKGASATCTIRFRVNVIVCSRPPTPSHGTVTCSHSRLFYGSSCTYKCQSGFSISGPGTVACQGSGRFSSTSTICQDVTPPKITSCPGTQTIFAKRNERTAVLTWPNLRASDNSGYPVTITQTSGQTKGSAVAPGHYQIQYKGVDRAGHKSDPCIFTITVKVIKCVAPNKDLMDYNCTTNDFLFGTLCHMSCEYGYRLTGGNPLTCERTGSKVLGIWTAVPQPTCVKVRCPRPIPSADGAMNCTDKKLEWGASCSFKCNVDYRLEGSSKLTCLKSGLFDDNAPKCVDNVPPVFDRCPSPVIVQATRNMRRAVATWPRPHATDNLGKVNVLQRKGYRSGSLFNSGMTQVYFDAVDDAGNKAVKACIFTVTVILMKCPLPDLRDDFLVYNCSEADYLFGTTCALSCPDGMVVYGSSEIVCETKTIGAPGVWVQNTRNEPRCFKEVKCPTLNPPENGVLVCEAYSGVCQMQCNNQHDSSRIYSKKDDAMFVCGSTEKWIPNSAIFSCTGTQGSRPRLPSEFFYYDGHCENKTTKQSIESNFEEAFLTSAFGRGCGGRCTFDQLYVSCS